MSTLVRVLTAETLIGTTVHPANAIVDADSTRAAALIAAGDVESIESVEFDIDDVPEAVDKAGIRLALAGSAQTLDLTSLGSAGAARAGVTGFSAVHSIVIRNLGTGTNSISVGNAASAPFDHFLGGTTPVLKVPAGCSVALSTRVAAGLTTSSKNNLKIDGGADTFAATVAISGIASS